jgi:hypothetical protein
LKGLVFSDIAPCSLAETASIIRVALLEEVSTPKEKYKLNAIKIKCRREYMALTDEDEEGYIKGRFITSSLHQILLGSSNQGGSDGSNKYHGGDR